MRSSDQSCRSGWRRGGTASGAEEILDEITPAIHRKVTCHWPRTIGFGWADHDSAASIQLLAQRIIVEALVGDQSANLNAFEQGLSPDAVMALTRQKQKVRQIAERIHQGDDLGGQAAA